MKILFWVDFSGEAGLRPGWTANLYTLLEMPVLPVKDSMMTLPTPADFSRGHGDIEGQVQRLEFSEHLTICGMAVAWHGSQQSFLDELPKLLAIGYHERLPEDARALMERSRRQPDSHDSAPRKRSLLCPEIAIKPSRSAQADELYVGNVIVFRNQQYVILATRSRSEPLVSRVQLITSRLDSDEEVVSMLCLKWHDTVSVIGQATLKFEVVD